MAAARPTDTGQRSALNGRGEGDAHFRSTTQYGDRVLSTLLADECPAFRSGLRSALEARGDLAVVGEAGTAAEAMRLASELQPDLAVVDVRFPDRSDVQACQEIIAAYPATLVVASVDWDVYLATAWTAGAAGFLLKRERIPDLVAAICQAAAGIPVFTPEQLRRGRGWLEGMGWRLRKVTAREWAVLRLVLDGKHNRQIAEALGLSEHTIEKHLSALLGKLGARSRGELIALAMRHHLDVCLAPGDGGNPPSEMPDSHQPGWRIPVLATAR